MIAGCTSEELPRGNFLHILFYLFTVIPFSHLSATFLLGRALAVLQQMCDPPLLLQSQHCSKDQSSSGSDTVHLPEGGARKGRAERKHLSWSHSLLSQDCR